MVDLVKQFIDEQIRLTGMPNQLITSYALENSHPYHDALIDHISQNRGSIIMPTRQCGITSVIIGYGLWYAITYPNSTIGHITINSQCSMTCKLALLNIIESMPSNVRPAITHNRQNDITLSNGSVIMFRPPHTSVFHGVTLDLITFDSFAYMQPKQQYEMIRCVLPALSNGGDIIISSSPNSDKDTFYELWISANGGIDPDSGLFHHDDDTAILKPFRLTYKDMPQIDDLIAKTIKSNIGYKSFSSEYDGYFKYK